MRKPYIFYFLLAVFCLFFELIRKYLYGNIVIEIPLHDTYFIYNMLFLMVCVFIILMIIGIIYFKCYKSNFNFNIWLSLAHQFSIFIFLIVFSYTQYMSNKIQPYPYLNIYKAINVFGLLSIIFFGLNLFVGFINRAK
jgi:hypothetical protein